jgi:LDH2 family malate/lactate/ureidoglycolate dehydrogenase
MSADHAEAMSDTLVESDLRGVHSHGVQRVPGYLEYLRSGDRNPRPHIRVVSDTGSTAIVDGDYGFGQVPSIQAMRLAIEKATTSGIAACGVRSSGHFGAAAYYAMMALEEDMIGFATTGGLACMAPPGGRDLVVGNNPICYAIPAGEELPVVLDMATSARAQGWTDYAALAGERIPLGWALDSEGNPTQDPQKAIQSNQVVPLGDYKGFGMAVVMDILAAVLTGADWGTRIEAKRAAGERIGDGHFFQAIKIGAFMPVAEFKAHMDQMIQAIKATRLAEGTERILLPGEMEYERKEVYSREGIPLLRTVVDGLLESGRAMGVEPGW